MLQFKQGLWNLSVGPTQDITGDLGHSAAYIILSVECGRVHEASL